MDSTESSNDRKKPGGIALRPELWERVRRLAQVQKKSQNQVMEECLSLHLPVVAEFRKTEEDVQPAQTTVRFTNG